MATREGIYVGGHEIVERYVGNRLVWEKFIFVANGDLRYSISGEKDISTDNTQLGYMLASIADVNKIVDSVKLEKNGVPFLGIKIKRQSSYFDGRDRFIISFPTKGERDKFLSLPGETKFYKKRGK
jgi:hypothetical protein|nr:MAG TPA: hypothetical protein [Caudoviricetes sp.]